MPKAEALSIGAIDLILLRILPIVVEDCASLQHHMDNDEEKREVSKHTQTSYSLEYYQSMSKISRLLCKLAASL